MIDITTNTSNKHIYWVFIPTFKDMNIKFKNFKIKKVETKPFEFFWKFRIDKK